MKITVLEKVKDNEIIETNKEEIYDIFEDDKKKKHK